MSTASYKATVQRYLVEVLDQRNVDALGDFWTADCVIHRPEAEQPIRGLTAFKEALARILHVYSELSTTVQDAFGEGDRVAVRLTHRAVNRGEWISRLGRHDVAGKPVVWSAIAIFRFQDGKIAEQWVSRDELGMLIQLGVVTPGRAG